MGTQNTVKVKKYSDIVEEYDAAAAITPGQLIEHISTGKVQRHSTAEGNALKMFALEDELQGKGLADNYALDNKVQCWVAGRGDHVNALLADGETVVIGSELASNGDGDLRLHDISSGGAEFPDALIGYALEAVDLSGSSGADPATRRLLIRVA